jgi:hypothetical protein
MREILFLQNLLKEFRIGSSKGSMGLVRLDFIASLSLGNL